MDLAPSSTGSAALKVKLKSILSFIGVIPQRRLIVLMIYSFPNTHYHRSQHLPVMLLH